MNKYIIILLVCCVHIAQSQIDTTYKNMERKITLSYHDWALDSINNYLKSDTNDVMLNCYKGIIYVFKGDSGKVFKNYIDSLKWNKNDSLTDFQIGELCYYFVHVILEKLPALHDPNYFNYDYYMLAVNSILESSLPYYEKAYELDKTDTLIRKRLIESYTRLKLMDPLKKIKNVE